MMKFVFCLALAGAPWFIPGNALSGNEDMPQFFLAFTALSGTLLGFVITGLSIFIAFGDRKLINNMKKTGHYSDLLQNFYITGFFLFFSMVLSLVCFFWKEIWIWKINFSIFGLSLGALIITGRRFYAVISIISKPEGNPNVLD